MRYVIAEADRPKYGGKLPELIMLRILELLDKRGATHYETSRYHLGSQTKRPSAGPGKAQWAESLGQRHADVIPNGVCEIPGFLEHLRVRERSESHLSNTCRI
jgi:hypothetical protein